MKQYQDLLREILRDVREKESGRTNMPNTFGINGALIRMDLQEGFPLLTTKQMPIKTILHELLWFISGDTNIKYLVDNGIKIWNGDAYRWYLKFVEETLTEPDYTFLMDSPELGKIRPFTMEEFIENIKSGRLGEREDYKLGDLGKVYGKQWRNQNGVDQIKDVVDGLRDNPYSRYHIIDAWNKVDFPDMALPPCHLLYQFLVNPLTLGERIQIYYQASDGATSIPHEAESMIKYLDDCKVPKFYLDLEMYQRSCDTFLGVPFNLASMSALLLIMAKVSNMEPGVAKWMGGDVHIYLDHIPVVKEQIERKPYDLPHLRIHKDLKTLDDILALTVDDFELLNYNCHPKMTAELFTGLKK